MEPKPVYVTKHAVTVTVLNGDYIAKKLRDMRISWEEAADISKSDTAAALSVLADVIELLPEKLQAIARDDQSDIINVYRGGVLVQVIQ